MELGLHIANFTWIGGPAAFAPTLATHVSSAEEVGISRITVMDHYWQIPGVGPVETEMYEPYTLLGFIAAHTRSARLHTLVTGVIYREPALLAKAVTTLDVVSGGRSGLGIGAAWNVEESEGLGFRFPPNKERLDRLEEAIRICLQLWSESEDPFEGAYYRLGRTLDSPGPLSRPYLMIGGGGERRTLRLVAQYADACNIGASPESEHKLEVLRAHCDAVGRDYDTVEKTTTLTLDPHETIDDLTVRIEALGALGFTAAYVFARGIADPVRIIDTLGAVVQRVG